jgi:hypothetical protein
MSILIAQPSGVIFSLAFQKFSIQRLRIVQAILFSALWRCMMRDSTPVETMPFRPRAL